MLGLAGKIAQVKRSLREFSVPPGSPPRENEQLMAVNATRESWFAFILRGITGRLLHMNFNNPNLTLNRDRLNDRFSDLTENSTFSFVHLTLYYSLYWIRFL